MKPKMKVALMLAVAFTLISGLDYVLRYGVRAWRRLGKGE